MKTIYRNRFLKNEKNNKSIGEIGIVKNSGLFDHEYYGKTQISLENVDAQIEHYLTIGEPSGVAPSKLFDPSFYLRANQDVRENGVSPLIHYINWGRAEGRYATSENLQRDAIELISSGEIDIRMYKERYGQTVFSPAEDYLLNWRFGRRANSSFDDLFYERAYLSNSNTKIPPMIHYIRNKDILIIFINPVELSAANSRIIDSFDFEFYRSQIDLASAAKITSDRDLVDHYLLVGVNEDLSPRRNFSPVYYRRLYSDIESAFVEPFQHYLESGIHENRKGNFDFESAYFRGSYVYNPELPTVIIVNHEASRTGAPLVGLNLAIAMQSRWNVFTFVGRDVGLLEEFCENSVGLILGWQPEVNTEAILRHLRIEFGLDYVLVNSVEGSRFVRAAARCGICVVALVHEFAEYTSPRGKTSDVLRLADKVIVPAQIIENSLQKESSNVCGIRAPNIAVRPQGRLPYLPESHGGNTLSETSLRNFVTQRCPGRTKIILGAGYVGIRKGIELFVQTASELNALRNDVAFIWVGDGYDPIHDMQYSVWVSQMIERMGLDQIVQFLPSQKNLESLFSISNAFFLSSRLDPFPNVVIDALHADLDVVCFEESTGCAELFSSGVFHGAAVPYCDVRAAANALSGIIDASRRGGENRSAAESYFNFDTYVAYVEDELRLAKAGRSEIDRATMTIYKSGVFDARFYEGMAISDVKGSIRDYVASSMKGMARRNPYPGFSDNLVADLALECQAQSPLDVALREKKQKPTTHSCYTIGSGKFLKHSVGQIAIHLHFHYADLAYDFVDRLNKSRVRLDVFATTTSQDGFREVEHAFMKFKGGRVQTSILPNQGRDIGPLMIDLADALSGYDVVGHFHAKKSLVLNGGSGDKWREFLLDTLIGRTDGVLSDILHLFAEDKTLGLVFAEDPHNVGWTENRVFAESIAERLSPQPKLPARPVFPIGTMFWCRADVLRPLWMLGLTPSDLPIEPLPYDGSILHALERMLPAVCESVGYNWATVRVPNSSR